MNFEPRIEKILRAIFITILAILALNELLIKEYPKPEKIKYFFALLNKEGITPKAIGLNEIKKMCVGSILFTNELSSREVFRFLKIFILFLPMSM